MKTPTDRKIAQNKKLLTKLKATNSRQTLERNCIADMQAEVVKAPGVLQMFDTVKKATGDATSVKISAENAEAIKVNANAEASKQL
jgi:predicted S18 family serine protease